MIDKKDYLNISKEFGTNINVNGENCRKYRECKYYLNRKGQPNAKYVLCTHDLLLPFLEEKIKTSYQGIITTKSQSL